MTDPLSPLIVGGTSADVLQAAISLNKNSTTDPTSAARADRFWSSQPALGDSDVQEVLEINYASAGITNFLSFDVARFPHTIIVEYSSSTADNWHPLLDSVTSQPIHFEVMGSYPPVLDDPSTIIGHYHPQHDYEGHWTQFTANVVPTSVQKLRFLLQRQNPLNGPVNLAGKRVPYSLALQNIDTGYTVSSEDDIPFHEDEQDSDTYGQVFANSADLFGSNLGFSKRTQRANNLLLNTDSDAPLVWKSEPQPRPNAVVNFYADVRDADGNAQIIDQIFVDPLYLGCSVNLYYSNDQTTGDFLSPRTGLTQNQIVYNGARVRIDGPLSLGTWHPTDGTNPAYFDPYYAQVDNFYLGFDPSIDWWVGIEWTRDWARTTDALAHDIFSCDAFRIGQTQDSFYLKTTAGDTLLINNFTTENIPIQIVAGYVGGYLYFKIQQGTEQIQIYDDEGNPAGYEAIPYVREVYIPVSQAIDSTIPGQLFVGATTDLSVFSGGAITSFILSQSSDALTNDFIDDPSGYSLVTQMPSQETKGKYNALLRFDTTQLTLTNSTGFLGGPGYPYDAMTWTPIPRSYQMQRGYMHVPLTKAKFWNLEITNLRPENVEKFVPVSRSVKFFPQELFSDTVQTQNNDRQSDDDLSLNVLQNSSGSYYFDVPTYTGTGDSASGITNTEVYVAEDYDVGQRLAGTGNDWTYEQFSADYTAPRFAKVCVHNYHVQQVTQTTNVSFFAGLRNIIFARTAVGVATNANVIEEPFFTEDNISSSNWISTDTGLFSGLGYGKTKAVATSAYISTLTPVRGLQFAVQQSDAQAIDIMGDFASPIYDPNDASTWAPIGDGRVLGMNYNQTANTSAFLVSRQPPPLPHYGLWADIPVNWGTTYSLLAHTYDDLAEGIKNTAQSYGGVTSQQIRMPVGGTVYAAVRATASQSLSEPLYVQIYDPDSGNVLAEAQSNVSKNETKRWFCEVDTMQFGAQTELRWRDLLNNRTYQTFYDSFSRTNSSNLGTMDSGQNWLTPTGYTSLTLNSNNALGGTNFRSQFDTGTPFGSFTVRFAGTVPTTTTHAAAIPLVDLGGILLLNDGSFQDQNLVSSWGTVGETLTSSHDYNFKFMLTKDVPSGQLTAGVFPGVQPYSLVITTGTLNSSETWLKTISSSRPPTSVRALLGNSSTRFARIAWVPSKEQTYNQARLIPGQFNPGISQAGTYTTVQGNNTYTYQGGFTYDTNTFAVRASSLNPAGAFLSPPTGLTLTPATGGGNFSSGTYYYRVTALNANGETTASTEANVSVVPGGSVNVFWNAVTNATNYNVYRGTAANGETLIGSTAGATLYLDTGDAGNSGATYPTYNNTNGAGTMQITDVLDSYGSFRINVAQIPSNMAAADVPLVYLDYNQLGKVIYTFRADGSIREETSGTTVFTINSFSATAGPLSFHYVNRALMSSAFLSANPSFTAATAILIYQAGNLLGIFQGASIGGNPYPAWSSTTRGLAGANNGTGSTQYTIIEGFNWNPNGSSLASDTTAPTWSNIDYSSTRTYAQMSQAITGTVNNLAVRVVQKGDTNDSWFIESAMLFWDPVVWEFSCDFGVTWWEGSDVRNDANGCLVFPTGLTSYTGLRWRVTSYGGKVGISHLAIRPWYQGTHGYNEPSPSHVPQGPNLVPADDYAPIDRDPRWQAWSNPVPHWWWG